MAGIYPITGDAGATYIVTFTWENSSGTPINLTDYSVAWTFSPQFGSSETLLDASSGVVLGGVAGTLECSLTPAQTAALPQSGAWMLVLTAPDGVVTRLVQGSFSFDRGAPS